MLGTGAEALVSFAQVLLESVALPLGLITVFVEVELELGAAVAFKFGAVVFPVGAVPLPFGITPFSGLSMGALPLVPELALVVGVPPP